MKPRPPKASHQADLFRMELAQLIDPKHELVQLTKSVNWSMFEEQWGAYFSDSGGTCALPTRLVAGLNYLKQLYKLSDEGVVKRWVENPYWQYFTGEVYFQHRLPCHPTSLTKWRNRLGEEGMKLLLQETIEIGKRTGTIDQSSCEKVIADTTVQEKHIAYPVDVRLLNKIRVQLVTLCKSYGLTLRQNYNQVSKKLLFKIHNYNHAKQFKRKKKAFNKFWHRVGRVVRDIERKLAASAEEIRLIFKPQLEQAHQLLHQTRQRKTKNKLYSLHAPEVECIAKGKAHKRYEFGVKASFVTTLREGFVVGAMSFPGNPYDGHTLKDQLKQVHDLCGHKPRECFADLGYRGHGVTTVSVYISRQKRGITPRIKRDLKRRNVIEPEIGHMKTEGWLSRCRLKGSQGDAINVLLVAAGHNLKKILKHLRILLSAIFERPIKSYFMPLRVFIDSAFAR